MKIERIEKYDAYNDKAEFVEMNLDLRKIITENIVDLLAGHSVLTPYGELYMTGIARFCLM